MLLLICSGMSMGFHFTVQLYFQGAEGFLLKSNLVRLSPKSGLLMKQICAVSNERQAEGTTLYSSFYRISFNIFSSFQTITHTQS